MKLNKEELVEVMKGKLLYDDSSIIITQLVESIELPLKNSLYFVRDYMDQDTLIQILKDSNASGVVIKDIYEYDLKSFIDHHLMVIVVDHVSTAFYVAIAYYRSLFGIPFIEVTGSAGKSTTKEMIGCILNEAYNTLVGVYSYNAPSGVAYNINNLNNQHKAAVLEAGMRDLGIFDLSSYMIKPSIGVITCIQSHYNELKSIEHIIEAKSEMLPYIDPTGALILNGDDTLSYMIDTSPFKGNIYRVGLNPRNDLYATNIIYHVDRIQFTVHDHLGQKVEYTLHTFGDYNIRNALLAIKVGLLLDVPHDLMVMGLKKFRPVH